MMRRVDHPTDHRRLPRTEATDRRGSRLRTRGVSWSASWWEKWKWSLMQGAATK